MIEDFATLAQNIYFWFTPEALYFAITVLLFHLGSQHYDDNFGTLKKITSNIINFKYIFRIFKISLVLHIVFLILNHKNFSVARYAEYHFQSLLIDSLLQNIVKIWILLLVFSSIIYGIFKPQITESIEEITFHRKYRWTRTKYYFFCFISYILILIIFFLTFKFIQYFDRLLISNNIFPYLEAASELPANEIVYKRGVYLSISLSFLVFLFLINALAKRISVRTTFAYNIENIFALIILSFALYSGFYSLLNYLINYNLMGLSDEWIKNDKLIGHFSVRFTSVIVMWSIIRFIFQTIFRNDFLSLLQSIFPIGRSDTFQGFSFGSKSYYDIYYFNQVGFYVLNIFVAEYLISSSHVDFNATILFGLLPIIVDDFFAIHTYVKRGISMDWWHKIKLHFFNLAFLVFSLLSLIHVANYLLLSLFIIFNIVLTISFINNEKLKEKSRW